METNGKINIYLPLLNTSWLFPEGVVSRMQARKPRKRGLID